MAKRPKRRMLNDRVREDLLYQLRWNVLATLEDIEITIGPSNQTTNVRLFCHPLANESLPDPPFTRINEVCINECLNKVDVRMAECQYKPPPALTIDNKDRKPTTLGQFIA